MKTWNLGVCLFALAVLIGLGGASSAEGTCGETTWDLTAGQYTDVGSVTVSNDADNLYVTYALDTTTYPGAYFYEELQMWAGLSLNDVPSTPGGKPIPGQFCQSDGGACSGSDGLDSAIGESTYTFVIPFDQLSITDVQDVCGETLYVFTHASVKYDKDGDGQVDDEDTAWGGDTGVNIGEPGSWYFYGSYAICCDNGDPDPPFCQTAFAKGGWVWTTMKKSNPENLPSLELTKNRWGWAIEITGFNVDLDGDGTNDAFSDTYDIYAGAGLNDTSKGVKVGTLSVDWDGTDVVVTYTMFSGYYLEEVHLYAGDTSPTTIAPGQYGNLAEFDPNETEYMLTVPVSDTDGDGIWLVAHAVVCNEE